MKTKLIIGLGNPGKDYEKTRHNAGFEVIDSFLKNNNLKLDNPSYNGLHLLTNYKGAKLIIAKPYTYMNLSGEYLVKVMNFYKITIEQVLVIYDDLDIETGEIKVRMTGSSGGQNGVKNIIEKVGTSNFARIRVGISRPKDKIAHDHVLGKLKGQELEKFLEGVVKAEEQIINFLEEKQPFVKPK